MSENIIEKLDDIAQEEHKSRSMLLREAAQKLIEEHRRGIEEAIKREKMREAVSLQDRLRKKSGKWDGVAEVRKWRERADYKFAEQVKGFRGIIRLSDM